VGRRRALIAAAVTLLVVLAAALYRWRSTVEEQRKAVFAFYLPWDDSSATVTSLANLLDRPAGNHGHVYVGPDGHLYVGGKRVRFLGVNICGSAAFPSKQEAEKIAARLAKFGVNIVRFHHMDAPWESFNIFDKRYGTRKLNEAALERLDYFIAKLKENGIYVNLNLLVSRRLTAADGLPPEIDQVDWKDQQVLGFFVDAVRELHKEYARQLLTHRNPYTNTTYAEEPAVAFVEIVNEQGLIHSWLGGVIDRLPEVFKRELRAKWNEWLRARYGSTEKLEEAWGGPTKLGDEVLANPSFERGLEGWVVEVHDGAQASYGVVSENGTRVLRIRVVKRGTANWHVQFNYPRIRVREGETYLVRFAARAEKEAYITVHIKQAHEPWYALSNVVTLKLTPEWRVYEVALGVSASDDNARLDISNLGALETTYYFANFSMRLFQGSGLKEGESLEAGTVDILSLSDFFSRSPQARRDWVEFLWELERGYFIDMYRYLKEELGVKALVIGTIVGCSTPNIMAELDVVDAHAYWQHPAFPGTPWDPQNWYVVNEPMVNHPLDGTIQWIASRRVLGKPYTVSEYNHPAPNTYDAEAFPTLAAYAALQDWDAIFAFDYGSSPRDARRIRGYFDIDQHPTKMVSLLLAHNIFVRGDVEPARTLVTYRLSPEDEKELIARGKVHAWDLPGAHHLGWDPAAPLVHRVALEVGAAAGAGQPPPSASAGPVYRSDNGQVVWDCSRRGRCVIVVNSPRTVAVIGFAGNRTFELGPVTLAVGSTLLNGFGVVGVTSVDGKSIGESERLLLITLGYAANNGMELREYGSGKVVARVRQDGVELREFNGPVTCAGSWGSAPTLVEGLRVRVALKVGGSVEVWALDSTGARKVRVPVRYEGGSAVFEVGPEYETLWYEIVVSR
jgi:hypothetical protein